MVNQHGGLALVGTLDDGAAAFDCDTDHVESYGDERANTEHWCYQDRADMPAHMA